MLSQGEPIRRRIRIAGRVQGVGFRYFVMRQADAMGVQGWVRNLPDGAVSCEAQAVPEVMERFQACLQQGPRFARVTDVEVEDLPPDPPSPGFRIR